MKSVSAITGVVSNDTLTYQQNGQVITIQVDSAEWYRWLEIATSFTFRSPEGFFTAHKERASNRRGGWYWRAYRQRQGRLLRFYLGVSARVTPQRLRAAASRLEHPEHAVREKKQLFPSSWALSTRTAAPSILATKLQIPRLPTQHVPRKHIVTVLEQSMQVALTLVCAPAGSGKTTLLAEWAAAATFPVAWLSLEAAENDPVRFLVYLIATLSHLDERIGATVQVDGTVLASGYEQVITGLLNDLVCVLQQDVAVILDDYHLLTSETVQDMLRFLLSHLPTHLHLIIGTRVDPPLPLARLRARGQLRELRMQELRFSSTEVDAFAHAMGLTLSGEAVDLLQRRAEGWIAGIQLFTLALRRHADADAFLRTGAAQLFANHRFLLDYVHEEVLAQQTPEVQHFLLHTCVLERLTGPLCDAITGQTGGQDQLAELLRANLFVSALDEAETWYRYHALFAESLRAYLHKQEPELIPELYRRASCWYEEQGWEEEACEYALLAKDISRAATLLARLVPHMIAQGKIMRLGQWVDQLPPAFIAESPQLYLTSTWLQPLRTSQLVHAERIVEHLEQQVQERAQDDPSSQAELQRELTLQRATAALTQGDVPLALSLAGEILPSLPDPATAWSQFTTLRQKMILSSAYRTSGNLQAAEQILLEAFTSDSPGINLLALVSLSDLYEVQGRLHALGHLFEAMFQSLAQSNNPSPLFLALAHARYAMLLYEWNRLAEADASTRQCMELGQDVEIPLLIPTLHIVCLWVQVRVLLARGDDEEARQQLEREVVSISHLPVPELQQHLGIMASRLALACGQLEAAMRWQATCGFHFDDPLETSLGSARFMGYMALARILIARGRNQRDAVALAQVLILLERMHTVAVDMGSRGWLIEIEMLTVLALQAQGKTKQALTRLGPLLAQAEPEGYVRLFADEGHAMAYLLAQVSAYTSASPSYIQTLLAAFPPRLEALPGLAHTDTQQLLVDPLSPREHEVLLLLTGGASNQQIASQLVISLNTAKRHVKHILAKLSAANRTQAVARARELHLL